MTRYVVYVSVHPFRGEPARMFGWEKSYRELLEYLNRFEEDKSVYTEEDHLSRYDDEQLVQFLTDADEDDGGHYHTVWGIEEKKVMFSTENA